MGLLIGVGDFGIGDLIQKADYLYQMLLELCSDQLDWDNVLNKPTDLAGYGITDAYTKAQIDAFLLEVAVGDHTHDFSDITNLPDSLLGYGILDAYTKQETDLLLEDRAEKVHTHEIEDINGLEELLLGIGWEIVESLPVPLKAKALYFVKPVAATRASIYITSAGPTVTAVEIDAVSYAFLATALGTKQNKHDGLSTEYVKGDGTYGAFNKAAIGLGNVSNFLPADMPISDSALNALSLKANDSEVLKKTGNQTKTSGILTFALSPQVPEPVSGQDAANKGYVDTLFEDSSGEASFLFESPSEEWIITHNLNRFPVPNIIVGGKQVGSDVEYLDNDVMKIVHSKPQTGLVTIAR